MFRVLATFIVALLVTLAGAGPGSGATTAEWRADLKSAAETLRLRHPDPFTRIGEREFSRRLTELERDLPRLTEEQRAVRTLQLFAAIGEGHTFADMVSEPFRQWYPIRVYEFTDGIYIVSAHRTVAYLAGAQILEIAGRPAAQVLRAARSLRGADNELGALEAVPAVSNAALMTGLGFASADGSLRLKVRRANGRISQVSLPPMAGNPTMEWINRNEVFGVGFGEFTDWVSAYRGLTADRFREPKPDPTRPLHLAYRRHFIGVPLPERGAYYVQVNYMYDAPDETMEQFFRRILSDVDKLKPRRLILDWRYNGGGDGSKVRGIIHQFIKREDSPPWQELYILTGRRTFSAGVNAVQAFFEHVDGNWVGEPSGAAFRHAGNAEQLTFPATGLQLTFSTVWHAGTSTGEASFTPVDVPAQFSGADYIAGQDPAVDAILRGDEMRSLPRIAQTDGGTALRKAFEERRSRFGDLGWWTPADMYAMNRMGYELRAANRTEDALEVFRINTEIYPDSWYTWDSLGEAQLAAGQLEKGIGSYRRSLQLNPANTPARRIIEEAEKRRSAQPRSS